MGGWVEREKLRELTDCDLYYKYEDEFSKRYSAKNRLCSFLLDSLFVAIWWFLDVF